MTHTPLSAEQIERLARKRAGAKMRWYVHALVYTGVNVGLMLLALQGGRPWFAAPLLGWGLALLLHGVAVWWLAPGGDLRERLVERERERAALAHRT